MIATPWIEDGRRERAARIRSARPASPEHKRQQCHRHHASRNALQWSGGAALFQPRTIALMGMFAKRVMRPEMMKRIAVPISRDMRILFSRASTAETKVINIVIAPNCGMAG